MRDKKVLLELFLLAILIVVSAVFYVTTGNKNQDNKVFYGGNIISMEGKTPQLVEAVAVKGDKIVYAGSKIEAIKSLSVKAVLIDLKGKTMVPGIIEPNSDLAAIGSIKAGKKADFTILADNPFQFDPVRLKDINIVGKVFNGKYSELVK
jgi:predicted amidohydrolase YtcJ